MEKSYAGYWKVFNVDPLAENYYYNSLYAFSENKVVAHIELEGLESKYFMDRRTSVENVNPYLSVNRQGSTAEVTLYNGLGNESGRTTITMAKNVDPSRVPDKSVAVVGEIAIASGEGKVTISSANRNSTDQARVMFENLEGKGPGQGVAAQKELYSGSPGSKVIDTYTKGKALQGIAGQFGGIIMNDQIMGTMEGKINDLGVSNVTNHASKDPNLNVVDVSPKSVQNTKEFVDAAKNHSSVSRMIPYPKDPGHHLEIKQK